MDFKTSVVLDVNICFDSVERANSLRGTKVNSTSVIHRNWIKFLSDCTIVSSLALSQVAHWRGLRFSARRVRQASHQELLQIIIVHFNVFNENKPVFEQDLFAESNIVRRAKSFFFSRGCF